MKFKNLNESHKKAVTRELLKEIECERFGIFDKTDPQNVEIEIMFPAVNAFNDHLLLYYNPGKHELSDCGYTYYYLGELGMDDQSADQLIRQQAKRHGCSVVDSSEIVIKTDETFKTIDGEEPINAVFPLLQCLTSIYAICEYQIFNNKKQHSERGKEGNHGLL